MVWVRLEDNYPRNRKVAALSDAAFRLDVSAICWSNTVGADGRILPHELTEIRAKATARHAAELVARGRWHAAGTPCPHSETCPAFTAEGGGWVIHDIWDQQKPAAVVEEEKKARAERQRKYMKKLTARRRAADASADTSRDTSADGQADNAPSPPRPAPKGRAGTDVPAAPPAAIGGGTAAAGVAETLASSLAIAKCRLCDERGYANGRVCDHDPAAADRAHRGAAAARDALRRPA